MNLKELHQKSTVSGEIDNMKLPRLPESSTGFYDANQMHDYAFAILSIQLKSNEAFVEVIKLLETVDDLLGLKINTADPETAINAVIELKKRAENIDASAVVKAIPNIKQDTITALNNLSEFGRVITSDPGSHQNGESIQKHAKFAFDGFTDAKTNIMEVFSWVCPALRTSSFNRGNTILGEWDIQRVKDTLNLHVTLSDKHYQNMADALNASL